MGSGDSAQYASAESFLQTWCWMLVRKNVHSDRLRMET